MRTFVPGVLVAFASMLALTNAQAADMPVKAPYAPVPYAPAAYSWNGFYVGGNVGYGWAHWSATATVGGASASAGEDLNGILGGVQVGYNWQLPSNLVLGVEGDIQATGQSHSRSATVGGVALTEKDQITYFATVRGRLGYAMGQYMPFITGGWGYGQLKNTLTVAGASFSTSNSHSAWVVGAGVEGAAWQNWTWKVEYLYLDTGSFTNNYPGGIALKSKVTDNIVRVGLNYHF